MIRGTMNLEQASEHVHLEANELRHYAQRGEIDAVKRGDDYVFEISKLNEWAQRNMLSQSRKALAKQHKSMLAQFAKEKKLDWSVVEYFNFEAMTLDLAAKGKGGVIRDMTDLADKSTCLYDPETLYKELVAREEIASTAVGGGVAFLHPRFHDPYIFSESFIAYARSPRGVFFGADDGEPTRHFFLICSTDHEEHLHILARLAMIAQDKDAVAKLDAAESLEEVLNVIGEAEKGYRK